MAFNRQTFKTRTLTAVVFAAVMLVGLLWNHWSFLILFSIIHFGCWWEYLKLVEKIQQTIFHPYIKMGLMVMGYGLVLWFCSQAYHIENYGLKENGSLPVSAAGFALLLAGIFQKNTIHIKAFGIGAAGLIYISLSWAFMLDLSATSMGLNVNSYSVAGEQGTAAQWSIPLVIIGSIWINDTMAYIVGSLIGKTPLSKVSPKKTWEGTIGGVILSVLTAGLVAWGVNFDIALFSVIAALSAISGTFGDLFESKLKRMAGVKDSGSLMPGHGGFLDRFDSLLIATPIVWLYIRLFIK
ncbi:MAG: phosphatidate cytidylyltransferase [Chitinophagaceae bacterium]|nr:phosphatidate cytidylyltransferase [Chitinophagaceae bacterium]MBL0271567.1 phosphatidate cytidylyltransferase [Chitinophagaceae bacterium]